MTDRTALLRTALTAPLLVLAAAATPAALAGQACLNDQDKKTCGTLAVTPAGAVQASGIGGAANETWIRVDFSMRNLGQTSTRFVALELTLAPDTAFRAADLSADPRMACSVADAPARVSCFADKLEGGQVLSGTVTARVPSSPGTFTVTEQLGWQGNTATTSESVQVTDSAGTTWVPANRSATVVTAREATVSAEQPYWAQVTCGPKPSPYYCRVRVVTDAPAFSCPTGIFLTATDGGPYVCRDAQQPRRWVEVDTNGTFTAADPFSFVLLEHSSIVPVLQLPPTAVAPTGSPPFAIFHAQNPTPPPATADAHAFADTCAAAAPSAPCLTSVERLPNGDWRASGLKPNDGSDLVAAAGLLGPLYAALDFLLARADADLIQPPVILR